MADNGSDRLASRLIGLFGASHDRHASSTQIERTGQLVEELFSPLCRNQIKAMSQSYRRMIGDNMRADIVTNSAWDKDMEDICLLTKGNDRHTPAEVVKCAAVATAHHDQKQLLDAFAIADQPTRIAMRCLLDKNDRLEAGNCIYTITSKGHLRTLSSDAGSFNKLFPSARAEIKQGNYGTCYLDSSLLGIARTKFGEFYLASMIKPAAHGAWLVTLPVEPEKPFTLKESDINTYFWQKGGVSADLGLRLLEAAYGMHRVRLGQVPSHSFKDEVVSDLRACAVGGTKTNMLAAGTGGDVGITLNDFTHKNSAFSPAWNKEDVKSTLNYWAQMGPDLVIEASSAEEKNYKGNTYLNWSQFIHTPDRQHNVIFNHAYTVLKIDSKKESVLLANPWDSSKPFSESYSDFFKFFDSASAVKLDRFQSQ